MPGRKRYEHPCQMGHSCLMLFCIQPNWLWGVTAHVHFGLAKLLWCMLCCLICLFFAVAVLIAFTPLHLVPVCCVLVLMCKSFFYIHFTIQTFFKVCTPFSAVSVNVLFIFSRYQSGSAALSGYQGNWGRVWSCLCPQHQPRLLKTSLRVCQRTGIYSDTCTNVVQSQSCLLGGRWSFKKFKRVDSGLE